MADNENDLEITEMEKQIGELEEQLSKLGAKGGLHYPDSEHGDLTGDGKRNKGGHQRRVKLHDQKVKKQGDGPDQEDDSDEDDMGKREYEDDSEVLKAKKKPPMMDDEPDADDDGSGDDWSQKGGKAKKALEDDESCVIEGQRVYKSVVGEGSYAILKGQAERLEKAEREIAKERDLRATAEFRKRADELYPHVIGSNEERGDLLKAMAAMPESLRKHLERVLTTQQKLAKAAFDRVGINPGDMEQLRKTAQGFKAKVDEIKKRDNCTTTEAMSKARVEDPEGFKAYQDDAPLAS